MLQMLEMSRRVEFGEVEFGVGVAEEWWMGLRCCKEFRSLENGRNAGDVSQSGSCRREIWSGDPEEWRMLSSCCKDLHGLENVRDAGDVS